MYNLFYTREKKDLTHLEEPSTMKMFSIAFTVIYFDTEDNTFDYKRCLLTVLYCGQRRRNSGDFGWNYLIKYRIQSDW